MSNHSSTDNRDQTTVERTLADLPVGACARIAAVVADNPEVATRLRHLGFRAGAVVEYLRRAPLGDPAIYRVRDCEMCLRRREAGCILIADEG